MLLVSVAALSAEMTVGAQGTFTVLSSNMEWLEGTEDLDVWGAQDYVQLGGGGSVFFRYTWLNTENTEKGKNGNSFVGVQGIQTGLGAITGKGKHQKIIGASRSFLYTDIEVPILLYTGVEHAKYGFGFAMPIGINVMFPVGKGTAKTAGFEEERGVGGIGFGIQVGLEFTYRFFKHNSVFIAPTYVAEFGSVRKNGVGMLRTAADGFGSRFDLSAGYAFTF